MSTSFEQQGIVVGLSPIDHHQVVVTSGHIALVMIGDVLTLKRSNLRVVEGDIVVEVIAIDQAVVSNHGYALCFCRRHYRSRLNTVRGSNHQDTVAFCQVSLSLGHFGTCTALGV